MINLAMAITFRFKSRLFGIVVDVRKGKNNGYRWIGLMILTRLLQMEKLRRRKVKTNTNMKSANVEMTKHQRLNIEERLTRDKERERNMLTRFSFSLISTFQSISLSLFPFRLIVSKTNIKSAFLRQPTNQRRS